MSDNMSDARAKAWEQDKAAGKTGEALALALAVTGRINADHTVVMCPSCGKPAPVGKKFKMFPDGGWKHFGSSGCYGDAHSVLVASGISFPDAVRFLAGKPTKVKLERPSEVPNLNVAKFEATTDLEVLNGVLVYGRKTGGVQAAAEFYSRWHISEAAVIESGAVMIKDVNHFTDAIIKRFGAERLINAGLFTDTEKGPRCMLSENFPVVEPHLHPSSSKPTYMQFRGSHAQAKRYADHKAGKRSYAGSEKFLSLRGTPRSAQIGIGLPRIATLPEGSTIYVVEGFKDVLAARTLGTEAYGIPGVDYRPGDAVLNLLRRHKIVVTLDGDAAGTEARDKLAEYLASRDINTDTHSLPEGQDIADRLVAKMAAGGCTCPTCRAQLAS